MLQTRVMPCLLLRGRALVKTIRFKDAKYVGDPVNTIRIFNEKEVDELIFLDITATPQRKEPPYALIEEIAAECFMPFTYGGGVQSVEQMQRLYSLGVEKIALNSAALANPSLIQHAAERFGSQSVVVAIDAKKTWRGYRVMSHGGRTKTKRTPVDWAREAERLGAGEILLTSIDRDGTMTGYDLALTESVAAAVQVPVIACGGAGAVEDFARAVQDAGASAAATGSLVVYQGPHRAVLINFPARDELEAVLA
ncbi:MAG: AglZ/HisF2 family acetamidino modification protein [Bacteroidota bacterium]